MIDIYNSQKVQSIFNFAFEDNFESNSAFLFYRIDEVNQQTKITINLGKESEFNSKKARRAGAKAIKIAKSLGFSSVLVNLNDKSKPEFIEGAILATYEPRNWKSEQKNNTFDLFFNNIDNPKIVEEILVLCQSVFFARNLTNTPPNKLTPSIMAQEMKERAEKYNIEVEIKDENEIKALKMGAFLAVGESSANPPRLIVLRYNGNPDSDERIGLVGKGINIDTGGYCIKPGNSMVTMKTDMAGGAAVCASLIALARNKVKINAVAVIPSAENRISNSSFVPGDIIDSMSGKTIEIGNTDAEGRLLLADGITYAIKEEGVTKVVDIATLTGAVITMFGKTTAGLMTNDDNFYNAFVNASEISGEQYWRLPDFEEYKNLIKTPNADLYNTSNDGCGTIAAALFVGAFCQGLPWIHLDIAGTGRVDPPKWEFQSKGASGAGVSTIYQLCKVLSCS